MGIRQIVLEEKDSEFLHKKSKVVEEFNDRLFSLLDDLVETLKSADGLGLAAPQVGVLKRAVICKINNEYIEMINPEIVEVEGECIDREGCLSIKGKYFNVLRPEKITVKFYERNNNLQKLTLKDYDARLVCHEVDHLNGILITDIKIEDLSGV